MTMSVTVHFKLLVISVETVSRDEAATAHGYQRYEPGYSDQIRCTDHWHFFHGGLFLFFPVVVLCVILHLVVAQPR